METATGTSTRSFQDAKSLLDRKCLELSGGSALLLGVISLAALGIEVDLQRLSLLPISPTQIYLTIL